MTDFHNLVLEAIDETPRTLPEICRRIYGAPVSDMRPVAAKVQGLVVNGRIYRTQQGMVYAYSRKTQPPKDK